ncbi:sugar transporter [Ophiocordyceps camponoti-floridani]|uniref:Sugar transporter n=1 Tax=Ophiocordyceps camponoti-floridani TaxID=2030778 RepID=A0A8H4Q7T3_9HYPO|nr:sugar transporter [Ophiocordyceps camponoti-floridani]
MGYRGAGARLRSVSPMAEANDEPRLWQAPAVSTQRMASVPSPRGPTMKDRFIGLWSRRQGSIAPDPTSRGVLPVEMSGGNPVAPDNGSVPELAHDLDGFGVLNPFADTNATPHEPAYLAQAYMEGTLDPFADPIAAPSPVLGRPDSSMSGSELRSHRRSVSASVGSSRYPPSIGSRSGLRSSFRSLASSFAERRNKFRSDPFDLEIEGLPDVDDIPEMPPLDTSNAAYTTHMRSGSHPTSSYYTSGVNSDWNLTLSSAAGPPLDPEAAAAYPGMSGRWTRQASREQGGDGFGQAR